MRNSSSKVYWLPYKKRGQRRTSAIQTAYLIIGGLGYIQEIMASLRRLLVTLRLMKRKSDSSDDIKTVN
jgi:hypothetical protein